ncbi:hypothetical protein HYW54_03590 [Candidatus Gottesmanbacteria bacterium]|nr:hypothetical protein [Candidatus Gottesmanbacteria bacterium]
MSLKQLVVLSIIIFLSIVFWIVFDLYHVATVTTITPTQEAQVKPLTPTFDNDIIGKIKNRMR